MAGQSDDCATWHALVAVDGVGWPGQPRSTDLLLPSWQRLPPLPACLSGFAPNRNHNADVFDALGKTLPTSQATQPVLALLCSDPFLTPDIAERAMRKHESVRVTNFPTVSMLGQAFVESSDDVGVGVGQEVAFLRALQAGGRSVGFAVSRPEDLGVWQQDPPDFWMVVPGFDALSGDTCDTAGQLALVTDIAQTTSSPVIAMSPGEMISLYAAQKAGASGLVAF